MEPVSESLPDLPQDEDGPVFAEPWQAQTFGLTLSLHQQGAFSWPEWARYLGDEIRRAQAQGDPDAGNSYYHHWLRALERIVTDRGLVTAPELLARRDAWDETARRTPHGQPIELDAGG